MIMSAGLNEGRKKVYDGSEIYEIRFEKHPVEYAREWMQSLFYALHAVKGIGASAKVLLIAYVGLMDDKSRVRMSGRDLAEECEMSYSTIKRAKVELREKGLIYLVREGRRPTDPDDVYICDFVGRWLNGESVGSNLAHRGSDVGSNLAHEAVGSNLAHTPSHVQVSTEGIESSDFFHPREIITLESVTPVLSDILNSLHLQKESDVDVGHADIGSNAREMYDELLDLFADPPEAEIVKPPKGHGEGLTLFKLQPPPPPSQGSARKLTRPKKPRLAQKMPEGFIDKMLDLCYGVKTTEQYLTVDVISKGRCTAALTTLLDSGADLGRFDEFAEWWKSFSTYRPSPESVVRNWYKAMGMEEGSPQPEDVEYEGKVAETSKHALQAEEYKRVEKGMFLKGLDNLTLTPEQRREWVERYDQEVEEGTR